MAKKTTNQEGNQYDKILKENAERIFLPLIEQRLGIKIKTFQPLQEKLQTTIEREMDFFYEVTTLKKDHFLLHLEFQTTNDTEMVYRAAEYHGMALRLKRLPIRHILIYLGTKKMTMTTYLKENEVFQGFEVIELNKLDTSNLLSSQVPEIILLAILSDIPIDQLELTLQIIVHKLKAVSKNENELSKYLKQLIVLSRLRKFENTTTKIVKAMPITYDIETDYLYLQGIEKGKKEGKKEGKAEGKIEGKQKKAIIGIINMLKKEFSLDLIAELLREKKSLVLQVQKELKKEKRIVERLKKKQSPKKIAQALKVSEIFVEVLKEIKVREDTSE